MTMGMAYYLPRSIPLTLGYRDLLDEAAGWQRAPVHLLEPPIDTAADRPGIDVEDFVEEHDLEPRFLNVVIVSRVAVHMKQEGIERTVDAIGQLGRELPVRLVIVGGGSAFERVQARAEQVNQALGRRAVVLTGPMADPRPAYEFADVVVGMGSSAIRGLAFGKPVVVVGVQGFSQTVTPESLPHFERAGFYGEGERRVDAARDPIVEELRELLVDTRRRGQLGEFGRRLVHDRFSLEAGARTLDRVYREAVGCRVGRPTRWADTVSTVRRTAVYKARDGGVIRRLGPRLSSVQRLVTSPR
jgi:glycosyltransferase involved in cell wall biosynthesis